MNNQREALAQRLRGLRDAQDLSLEALAEATGIEPALLAAYENGEKDIPLSYLSTVAAHCGIDPAQLLTGGNPRAKKYFITRRGTGPVVERRAAYHYEALGAQFAGKVMTPFIVTVEPGDGTLHLNTHPGQEFNLLIEGALAIEVDGHRSELAPGDSIYFDATTPHGMLALGGKPARFLAVITP